MFCAAADLYVEAGLTIEYGPGKRGVGENLFLYVREPGGMRVELFSTAVTCCTRPISFRSNGRSRRELSTFGIPNRIIPDGYLFDAFPPLDDDRGGEKARHQLRATIGSKGLARDPTGGIRAFRSYRVASKPAKNRTKAAE